jgi:CHAT domain-containing protein
MGSRTGRSATRDTASAAILTLVLAAAAACSRGNADERYRQALIAYSTGKLAQAAELAAQGAAEWQTHPESPAYHRFRLLQAESLTAQGKVKDAEALLSAPLPRELRQLEARRSIDLASLRLAQPEEASSLIERAKAAAQDPELKVRVHNATGLLALARREWEPAAAAFRQAAELAAASHIPYWQAQALNNLSVALRRLNRWEDTEDVLLRALPIAEGAAARRVAAQAHGNLGTTYSYLGETKLAVEHEELSVKANDEIGDRVNLSIALGDLGVLYDRAGESAKAIPHLERAYRLAAELQREADAGRHAENLATALIKLERWEDAARWNEVAEESITRLKRTESMPYLVRNRARIEFGRGSLAAATRTAEGLLRTKDVPLDIQWAVHSLLGEVAWRNRQFERARQEFEKGIRVVEQLRSELVTPQYRMTLLSRLMHFYRTYVELLVSQGDDAGALRIVEKSRARVLGERLGRTLAVEPVRDMAAPRRFAQQQKAVLLSFWFAQDRSFVWLIDGKGVRRFDLPGSAGIEKQVTAYRETVEHSLVDPLATPGAAATNPWSSLLEGAAAAIPAGSRVIVIPDGPLHRFNLETLIAPTPKPHYWIEDVEIAVSPSIALAIATPPRRTRASPALLLIGAPDYAGTRYEPLPGANGELRDIPRYFAGAESSLHTGSEASPAAYKTSDPGRFSLIHFAAHAEANDEKPLESAVVLTRGPAGAKLYARDVIDLPIRADLVTLSACRSAGVRAYEGEGLIGFAWAFLQAGARAVVAGLWEVSDSSSRPLMGHFYSGVGPGNNPISALRQAKLTLMKDPRFRKPFFWAPFQVYVGSAAR